MLKKDKLFSFCRLSVMIFLVLFSSLTKASTIYVSTNGSDTTGNGSENNPYATLQKGVDEASAGDTVFVKAGTYENNNTVLTSSNSGTSNSRITLEGELDANGNRLVTLDGGCSITSWTLATSLLSLATCSEYGIYQIHKDDLPAFFDYTHSSGPSVRMPCHMVWSSGASEPYRMIAMTNVNNVDFNDPQTGVWSETSAETRLIELLTMDDEDSLWDGIEVICAAWGNWTDANDDDDYVYIRFRNGNNPNNEDIKFGKDWEYDITDNAVINLVDADYVTVKNFNIHNATVGIMLRDGASDDIIENNFIEHGRMGVFIYGYSGLPESNEIKNNDMTINYIDDMSPANPLHRQIWDHFKLRGFYDHWAVYLLYSGNDNKIHDNNIYINIGMAYKIQLRIWVITIEMIFVRTSKFIIILLMNYVTTAWNWGELMLMPNGTII